MKSGSCFRRALERLSPRDRRALRIAAIILAPVLLWKAMLHPYFNSLRSHQSALEQEQILLTKEMNLLAQARSFKPRFDAGATALLAEAPRLFDGADTVAAAAALAAYVADQAQAHRVFVQGTQSEASAPSSNGVYVLRVRLSGASDLEGVLRLLQVLHGGSKLVGVEAASLSRAARFGQPDDAATEVLAFQLTIVGYALAPVGKS
jgi:hypothetical protein